MIFTGIYTILFWCSKGKESPVDQVDLLFTGLLLIFILPIIICAIGWFFFFCVQQARLDWKHGCFDDISKAYWSSIRAGVSEALVILLFYILIFVFIILLFLKLMKTFKEKEKYFEAQIGLDTLMNGDSDGSQKDSKSSSSGEEEEEYAPGELFVKESDRRVHRGRRRQKGETESDLDKIRSISDIGVVGMKDHSVRNNEHVTETKEDNDVPPKHNELSDREVIQKPEDKPQSHSSEDDDQDVYIAPKLNRKQTRREKDNSDVKVKAQREREAAEQLEIEKEREERRKKKEDQARRRKEREEQEKNTNFNFNDYYKDTEKEDSNTQGIGGVSRANQYQKLRDKNRKRIAEKERERVKNYGRPGNTDGISSIRTNNTGMSRFRGVNDKSNMRGSRKPPSFMNDIMKVVDGNDGKKPDFNKKRKK